MSKVGLQWSSPPQRSFSCSSLLHTIFCWQSTSKALGNWLRGRIGSSKCLSVMNFCKQRTSFRRHLVRTALPWKKKGVKLTLWNNILEVISFKELYLLSVLFVMDFAFRIFFFPYRPPFWNCVADNRCELVPRLWFPIPGSKFFFHFPFPVLGSPFVAPRSSFSFPL